MLRASHRAGLANQRARTELHLLVGETIWWLKLISQSKARIVLNREVVECGIPDRWSNLEVLRTDWSSEKGICGLNEWWCGSWLVDDFRDGYWILLFWNWLNLFLFLFDFEITL